MHNLQRRRPNTEKVEARYSVVFTYIALLCFINNFQFLLNILLGDQLQSCKSKLFVINKR